MTKKISIHFIFIFTILFFLDGILSVSCDLLNYFSDKQILTGPRDTLSYIVMFLCIPYTFVFFFIKSPKIPAYWFLPIYIVITAVGFAISTVNLINSTSLFNMLALAVSPHWVYKNHPDFFLFHFSLSVTQLIIGTYCLIKVKKNFKLLEFHNFKQAHWFLAGMTSSSLAAGYVALNIATVVSMLMGATKGFLAFDGTNIQSIEKIYAKNGKIVHLIPMIHVGSETFYKEINEISNDKKTLFLLEGVSDVKNLMEPLNYRGVASQIGLESQQDHFNPPDGKHLKKNIFYQTTDVDASDLSKETRDFINKISKIMNEKSFFELVVNGNDLLPSLDGTASIAMDVVTKRNAKVFEHLKKQEKTFEEFYIPWGAAHLPEMERELLKMGYTQTAVKERSVISIMELANKLASK